MSIMFITRHSRSFLEVVEPELERDECYRHMELNKIPKKPKRQPTLKQCNFIPCGELHQLTNLSGK